MLSKLHKARGIKGKCKMKIIDWVKSAMPLMTTVSIFGKMLLTPFEQPLPLELIFYTPKAQL